MRALPWRTVAKLRVLVEEAIEGKVRFPVADLLDLRAGIDSVLKRSTKAKAARSARADEKKTRKAAHNSETSEIRRLVFERADGRCESGWAASSGLACGIPPTVLDHFFGKAKVPQAVSNCWALCRWHDRDKTDNKPSAAFWFDRFIRHAKHHGYHAEASRAERDHRSGQ